MLPVPFTFSGRIGRLAYFKSCLALVAACFIPVLLLLGSYSSIRAGKASALIGLIVILALFAVIMLWISLALQVRRCRDMGWNPLYVIPGWIALAFADRLVAASFPAWGVGQHHNETILGVALNLVMMFTLMFWPSAEDDGSQSGPLLPSGLPRTRLEAVRAMRPPAPAPATTANPVPKTPIPARVQFGRRA